MIQAKMFAEKINPPAIFTDDIVLRNSSNHYKAVICLCHLYDLKDWRYLECILHSQEKAHFETLKFAKRRKSYALGRITAKHAISSFVNEKDPRHILIQQGVFSHPVVNFRENPNVQVSITHCDDLGASIVFSEMCPMGIDIERVNFENQKVIRAQLTNKEISLLETLPYSQHEMLALFWTAKEALSKILKTGLMTPMAVYEVEGIEFMDSHYISHFNNFGQYRAISFQLGSYVCSIVYPKNMEMDIDLHGLQCFQQSSMDSKNP